MEELELMELSRMKTPKRKEPKTPITLSYAKKLLRRNSNLTSGDIPDELAECKMAQLKLIRAIREAK